MGDSSHFKRRSRLTPPGAGLGNVILLDAFRLREKERVQRHTLFYLTHNHRWLSLLKSFPFLQVESIRSELRLKSKLLAETPHLVLLEASIVWSEPVRLIKTLTSLLDVPTVLVYRPEDLKGNPSLLKEAFAMGLHDTLCAPLQREELWETLDVLLKARRRLGS